MRFLFSVSSAWVVSLFIATSVHANEPVFEDFDGGAEARWDYVADTVMGGVSEGGAVMAKIDGEAGMRLTGDVSTKNNGGFIQARRLLPKGLPADTTGLELDVRTNGEPYYIFIRTREMSRPWYFYNAQFSASTDWETVRIPMATFERSHAHLSEAIDPQEVISIGLAAYGRDHKADLMVREIRLY